MELLRDGSIAPDKCKQLARHRSLNRESRRREAEREEG